MASCAQDATVFRSEKLFQAVYVDSVGFQDVSHLLPELHELAVQRQKEQVREEPER